MQLRLQPTVQAELDEAAGWYRNGGGPVAAQRWLAAVDRTAALLKESPNLGSHVAAKARTMVIRRFPYSLVYRASPDGVPVMAVAHHRLEPEYWAGQR